MGRLLRSKINNVLYYATPALLKRVPDDFEEISEAFLIKPELKQEEVKPETPAVEVKEKIIEAAKEEPKQEKSKIQKIVDAITKLDPITGFNKEGIPKIPSLLSITKLRIGEITNKERDEAWALYRKK